MNHITDRDDEQDDRRALRRRSTDQPSLAKTFGLAVVTIGLVGSIFTAGYNWRSVAIIEANQDQFVRKDVQGEQLNNVNTRLNELVRQLEEMRQEMRAQRRGKE